MCSAPKTPKMVVIPNPEKVKGRDFFALWDKFEIRVQKCPRVWSKMARLIRFSKLAILATSACAHNSLVIPTPRNAIDGQVSAMRGGGTVPGGITCTCADSKDCPMGEAREVGGAGQPCLWWSQGCSIGCDYCLTDPRHPDNNGTIRAPPPGFCQPTAPLAATPP